MTNETREWGRARLYADAVEATTLDELVALYNEIVMDPSTRRKLSVMMFPNKRPMQPPRPGAGAGAGGERVVYLDEPEWLAFRSARPLFPCTPDHPSSSL